MHLCVLLFLRNHIPQIPSKLAQKMVQTGDLYIWCLLAIKLLALFYWADTCRDGYRLESTPGQFGKGLITLGTRSARGCWMYTLQFNLQTTVTYHDFHTVTIHFTAIWKPVWHYSCHHMAFLKPESAILTIGWSWKECPVLLGTQGHALAVTCRYQGSHTLKNTRLHYLFYS